MRKLHRYMKPAVIAILCMAFITGLLLGFRKQTSLNSTNQLFEEFCDTLFVQQVSANTLNLHYTLAAPEAYGITDYDLSVGSIDTSQIAQYYSALENYQGVLKAFSYADLTPANQLTRDILELHFETELSLGKQYHLQEVLSPSLGIQAQLPILLAEYTFRTERDIQDYLLLLQSIPTYFSEILSFEEGKSAAGLFMSDTTADRIIAQCSAFIADPDNNYLTVIFAEKLQDFPDLNETQKQEYLEQNRTAMSSYVIPAYHDLSEGLKSLQGTGKNTNGLYYFEGGKEYYTYLLKSNVGVYDSIEEIQSRLYKQLLADYDEVTELLTEDPSLAVSSITNDYQTGTPKQILQELQQKMTADFPAIKDVSYDIKYVHSDLEDYLSPAFYLTPPIDTLSPNSIYINQSSNLDGLSLYTTLAHEGFPGHLYQTIYFASQEPAAIRSLLNTSGYIEGWATYVESYAYEYADAEENVGRMLWLNRSINLCICSILDVGIHYYGWTSANTASFLQKFGITDSAAAREIFQTIVEDPANYLNYYLGYLNFVDLREAAQAQQSDDFQLKQFHQNVLEIGSAPFSILEKYLLEAS